jgi:hypothetical protein
MRRSSRALCAVLSILSLATPRFLYAQAPSAKALELDSLLRALRSPDWSLTADSLQSSALRYMGIGAKLSSADSIRALASFIAAAHSPDAFTRLRAPYIAIRIPLPEFAEVMQELADRDVTQLDDGEPTFVRDAAVRAVTVLTPMWLSMTTEARLRALERDVAAACLEAAGSLIVPCNAMRAELRQFRLRMRYSDPARTAINAFQKSTARAARAGLDTLTVLVLSTNAAMLEQSTFHVSVEPRVVRNAGDTIAMTYIVHMLSPKTDSLASFLVDAPALVHADLPGPRKKWLVFSRVRERKAVSWSTLDRMFGAGESTPPLPLTGRGLLAIVRFWAERSEPLDSVDREHITDSLALPDTLIAINGARGFTVGVVPFPADLSAPALANRLASLIDQSCELGWIDDRQTCSELRASAAVNPDALRAILERLKTLRRTRISESAYLLLEQNVRYLLMRISR